MRTRQILLTGNIVRGAAPLAWTHRPQELQHVVRSVSECAELALLAHDERDVDAHSGLHIRFAHTGGGGLDAPVE